MTKGSTEITPKPVTKKHMARLEKEDKQKKFLLLGIIAVLVVVVGLITYGILDSTVLLAGKPVAKVGSTKITVEQFQKTVKYDRMSMVQNFVNYAASPFAAFFQSQLLQVQNQLDKSLQFGSDTLDTMITNAVVAAKAKELGITVSDEEIAKELEKGFGYYPNGTPTPEPTIEYRPTSTLSSTQLAIVTITPTPTEAPTETPIPATPTIEVTSTATLPADVTPTVTEVPPTSTPTEIPTPEATPTITEIPPTPTPYTREGYEALYGQMLTSIAPDTGFTKADFTDYVKGLLINQKVYEYVTKDISVDQDMVWAHHILVATEEEANTVLTRLKAGEDWAKLAAELSTDTSNSSSGGDLGWFYKGQMVGPFETAAYSLAIGEISAPVKTDFGYHIIQVLGHEVRQLTSDQLSTMKSAAYSKFVEAAKAEMTIKKFDIWAKVVPSTPTIPDAYRIKQ